MASLRVHPLILAAAGVAGLAALPRDAVAQASPPVPVDAGQLLRQQQPAQQPPAPPATPPLAAPPLPGTASGGEARVTVRGFRLTGQPEAIDEATLLARLAPAQGRTLSLDELRAAVGAVTALYQSRGYFLARAVLPPQDLTDGIVTVHVLEGRLEPGSGLQVAPAAGDTPPRLDPALAMRVLAQDLPAGQALHLPTLERNLLLLDDLPGVQAAGRLEPGDLPDTTRVRVDLAEGPGIQAVVSADNHGSRYTDSKRLGVQAQWHNPTGQGDQLQLQATASPGGDYRHARLGYSVLAAANGLRVTASVSDLQYRVGAELAALQAEGGASVASVAARQPLQRSRRLNLWASATVELKHLRNSALGSRTSDKRLDLLTLGLAADRRSARAVDWFELGWSAGTLDLSRNAASLAQDQAGPRTQGGFTRWTLAGGRLQALSPALTLALQGQAQWAPHNLDSGEKFLLGGAQGVRAYPGSEAAGDSGVRGSVELRWQALQHPQAGRLELSAFVDAGRIRQWARPDGLNLATPNSYALSAAGLGSTLTLPGGHLLRLEGAVPLARNPGRDPRTGLDADGRARTSRVWVSAQLRF